MFVFYIILLLTIGNTLTGLPYDKPNVIRDVTSSRIVGGEDAPDGYAPHMVALLIGNDFVSMICGGSMVSTRHVLTAAHCIYAVLSCHCEDKDMRLSSTLRGIVGSNDYSSTENVITFTHYINHPEYDSVTLKNDVGVLITTQEIQMNDRVAIISLKQSWVGAQEDCYVTGWGARSSDVVVVNSLRLEQLQLLHVNTLGPQECVDAVYSASEQFGVPFPPVDPRVEICTFHSPGHGMCNGDSGSALVCSGEQVGVVSWGYPCAMGAPDVFARISGVLDFLKSILNQKLKD